MPGLEAIRSARHDGLHVSLCLGGAFLGFQLGNGLAQQFLLGVAAHPAVGSVDLQQTPLEVSHPETVLGGLDNGLAALLARQQPVRRLLALGDVGVRADHAQCFTRCVALHRQTAVKNPFPAAVLAAHAMLIAVVRRGSIQMRLRIGHRLRLVVGVDARRPLVQAVADFVFGVTQHLLPTCAEEDRAGRHIPVPQAVTGAFDGKLPAKFALK